MAAALLVRLTSNLLYQGHDVTIADIAPSPSYPDLRINADVREYESLLAACSECDTIINLAAAHRDNAPYFPIIMTPT